MDREEEQGGTFPTAAGPVSRPPETEPHPWARGSLEFIEPLFKVPRGGSPGPCSDHQRRLVAPTQPQGHNQGHVGEGVP